MFGYLKNYFCFHAYFSWFILSIWIHIVNLFCYFYAYLLVWLRFTFRSWREHTYFLVKKKLHDMCKSMWIPSNIWINERYRKPQHNTEMNNMDPTKEPGWTLVSRRVNSSCFLRDDRHVIHIAKSCRTPLSAMKHTTQIV